MALDFDQVIRPLRRPKIRQEVGNAPENGWGMVLRIIG